VAPWNSEIDGGGRSVSPPNGTASHDRPLVPNKTAALGAFCSVPLQARLSPDKQNFPLQQPLPKEADSGQASIGPFRSSPSTGASISLRPSPCLVSTSSVAFNHHLPQASWLSCRQVFAASDPSLSLPQHSSLSALTYAKWQPGSEDEGFDADAEGLWASFYDRHPNLRDFAWFRHSVIRPQTPSPDDLRSSDRAPVAMLSSLAEPCSISTSTSGFHAVCPCSPFNRPARHLVVSSHWPFSDL
jgi:hypothetical protein